MDELMHSGPTDAEQRVVLAHGAGAAMDSPFMQEFALGLGAAGIAVTRFEFPYMRKRRSGARRPPDPPAVLQRAWREVIEALGGAQKLVIGGKSLGGRIASLIADDVGARGLLCLGYPFHPTGKPEQLRTAHLAGLRTRTLIVQGTRDTLGSREEIADYALSPSIRLHFIEDGDHSLKPRKRAGHDPRAAMQEAIDVAAEFVRGL